MRVLLINKNTVPYQPAEFLVQRKNRFQEIVAVDRTIMNSRIPRMNHIAGTISDKALMITPVGTGMRSQCLATADQVLIVHWSTPFVFAVSSLRAPAYWQRAHLAVLDCQ